MYLRDLQALAPASYQAVIINVNTRLVSTLALLGALRHADMPVLLVDCESSDGSLEHFRALMSEHRFDLLSAPLRRHGDTLDWLFAQVPAQHLLLIDSDLELLGGGLIGLMRQLQAHPLSFGSGFVHPGQWMVAQGMRFGYYMERMWIPLTLLDVGRVREALAAGCSFAARTLHNDFPPSPLLSRLLVKRFRVPLLKHSRLGWLDRFRREFAGVKPSFVQYDTGAEVYEQLCGRGYEFMGLPWRLQERTLVHFHGVTRLLLNRRDRNGVEIADVVGHVQRRLHDAYGLSVAP